MELVKPLKNKKGDQVGWYFYCPGCKCNHSINDGWKFNGDAKKPTITPSVLVNGNTKMLNPNATRCHLFVSEGKLRFLGDCDHELKNQTVDMEPLENV